MPLFRLLLSCCFFCVSCVVLHAQLPLSTPFNTLLEQADLDFFTPVENQYKVKKSVRNDLMAHDLVLRKKRSDLEIRYSIFPHTDSPLEQIPHLRCLTAAMSLASNSDDSVLSIHTLQSTELQQVFHADWGGVVYFQPKPSFSTKKHCKMLALQAEGKALVYVFFLFDNVEEELPSTLASLQFKH